MTPRILKCKHAEELPALGRDVGRLLVVPRQTPSPPNCARSTSRSSSSAEDFYLAKDTLRFLPASTTPEPFRAAMGHVKCIAVTDVVQRERVPTAAISNRIRLAHEDFRAAPAREHARVFIRRRK